MQIVSFFYSNATKRLAYEPSKYILHILLIEFNYEILMRLIALEKNNNKKKTNSAQ